MSMTQMFHIAQYPASLSAKSFLCCPSRVWRPLRGHDANSPLNDAPKCSLKNNSNCPSSQVLGHAECLDPQGSYKLMRFLSLFQIRKFTCSSVPHVSSARRMRHMKNVCLHDFICGIRSSAIPRLVPQFQLIPK